MLRRFIAAVRGGLPIFPAIGNIADEWANPHSLGGYSDRPTIVVVAGREMASRKVFAAEPQLYWATFILPDINGHSRVAVVILLPSRRWEGAAWLVLIRDGG